MYYIKSDKGYWLLVTGYWLPGAYGYTHSKKEAGIFSLVDMKKLALDGCELEVVYE